MIFLQTDLDPSKLVTFLEYGPAGLAALLFLLSFILLTIELRRSEVRERAVKIIRLYMRYSLILAVLAFGVMLIRSFVLKPSQEEKKELEQRTDVLAEHAADEIAYNYDAQRNKGIPTISEITEVVEVPENPEDTTRAELPREVEVPDADDL